MVKVYVAHPFATETSGSAKLLFWKLQHDFPDWMFINPFDDPLTKRWEEMPTQAIAKKIVEKDLAFIRNCDLVLAYLSDIVFEEIGYATIGTAMEIFYAGHVLKKPIYCLTRFCHPWLLAFNVKTESDYEKLKNTLKEDFK